MHAKIGGAPTLEQQLASLRRLALAVAHPGGPALHADLVRELAAALDVAVVFVAVYADDERTTLRTLAAQLDGRLLKNFSYLLRDSPCVRAVTPGFHYVPAGVAAEFRPDTIFAAKGMDAYAAYPLAGSTGEPLGLLVAMDRQPIVGGDVEYAEAMLKIVAGRLAAEIERSRTDEVLRTTALAVSGARSGTVFDELVRLLAATLHVEQAFIARHEPTDPAHLSMLARYEDGQVMHDFRYPVAGTPCETVLGQRFRAFPEGLQQHFPDDADVRAQGVESYAGFPLMASDGRPLGILAVTSRRPLKQVERAEAMLKIVAVRAAAEIERLAANEALARSEASYRTIFDNAEDAIFIHDWETGRILDANRRACESFGWTREEFAKLSVAEICAGMPPYTVDDALRWIRLAKLDRCPPFEWRRRNKDGSLRWDEVRLKPTTIDGRPHVLAFARDITERKTALSTLQAQEQKYRSIFDSTADSMVLWNDELRVVDVNAAFVDMTGLTREEIVGRHWTERPDRDDIERLLPRIEGALAGREESAIERVSRADGTAFDIELRYLPVRFGDARYALGVGRDVSARLEHERELARSTARLRATVEAAFDGVIGMDGQGRIVEFNAAAERIFGHRRQDVLGRLLADVLLPQRHREAHTRGLARFHGAGQGSMIGRLVETTALHAAGHEIPVELAISVAAVPEGSIFVGHVRDITERRRADQALRDSEAQYRAIFNASADPLVLRDADFRIVDVNLAYEAMSGYTRDEVIGADHLTVNPAEMTDVIRTLHARALVGEAIAVDTHFVRRDGKRYDLELRGVPIQHQSRPHVLYVGRDITERKRAEEALRDSEAQYRAIFNASVDALVLWDSQYRRVDVNQAYERIFGWKRHEVIGRGYEHPIFSSEYVLQRRELIRRALAGEVCSAELEGVHKNGQRIQIEVHVIPFLQRGERHVLAISRNITERKRAEDALRDSEAQYRAIFNASADALLLRDAEFRIVEVNPAYTTLSGYSRDELLASPRVMWQEDERMQQLHRADHDRVLAGEVLRLEHTARRKDGRTLQIEVRGTPVSYRGRPHVLYAVRDMTERHAAEQRRVELERQLRQAQKMEAIGQLTGGIAHDFNNILASVIGYLVLAQERAEAMADATLVRQLGQAHLAADRARGLIAQMLAFARRQRGDRRVLQIAPLVQETLSLLRATLPSTVTLEAEASSSDAELPSVEADPVQLEQVLFNLCINARDATGGQGRIGVRLQCVDTAPAWHCASCRAAVAGGPWVVLSVEDDGPGIDPEHVERIFDPFFSTKAPGKGSGMGLAMVHGIVHDHGGHLQLDSAPGRGARFAIWLPRATSLEAEAVGAPAVPPALVPLQGRVLLVEDDTMLGDFLCERLSGWGLDVELKRESPAADAWLSDPAHTVDLLITDQTMPSLTGLQLAARTHARRPTLPIVLISGNADAFEHEELTRCGVSAALPKPLDGEQLRAVLRRLLADTAAIQVGR